MPPERVLKAWPPGTLSGSYQSQRRMAMIARGLKERWCRQSTPRGDRMGHCSHPPFLGLLRDTSSGPFLSNSVNTRRARRPMVRDARRLRRLPLTASRNRLGLSGTGSSLAWHRGRNFRDYRSRRRSSRHSVCWSRWGSPSGHGDNVRASGKLSNSPMPDCSGWRASTSQRSALQPTRSLGLPSTTARRLCSR